MVRGMRGEGVPRGTSQKLTRCKENGREVYGEVASSRKVRDLLSIENAKIKDMDVDNETRFGGKGRKHRRRQEDGDGG